MRQIMLLLLYPKGLKCQQFKFRGHCNVAGTAPEHLQGLHSQCIRVRRVCVVCSLDCKVSINIFCTFKTFPLQFFLLQMLLLSYLNCKHFYVI